MTINIKPADTDVDIDLQNRDAVLSGLDYVQATRKQKGVLLPHNTGVYFQQIPKNPITGMASISAKDAEKRGYFKIDLLNVHLYDGIRNEQHIIDLMKIEPLWELLDHEEFVEDLWHIGNHFNLVSKMKPRTINQLAIVLAVIRPAKSHLQNESWAEIEKTVWIKPLQGDKGYDYRKSMFKKSHAIAYSLGITIQMNLIVEQLS